ncbi:MAG: flagellar hook protein FlgE, partial [Oligoflexia bacterium]|nr:flagellar hook protein FlgE [Oligoflexia bacterium]
MPSIVNGLFSGRSGISSHGAAIAVVGDNISNSSTIGYKASRAEFEDLIAGGQTSGRVIGSGSSTSAVSMIFEQGTLEFTSRPLDLAIDGNGLFVVSDNGQRFYTRAGNFRLDSAGNIIDQNGFQVLGFPAGGSGALEALNINTVSQDSVATESVAVTGNLDRGTTEGAIGSPVSDAIDAGDAQPTTEPVTYAELNAAAAFSTVVEVFDSLGQSHTITTFFFHTDDNEFTARSYVNNEDVDPSSTHVGYPRYLVPDDTAQAGGLEMTFNANGELEATSDSSFQVAVPWNNGADNDTLLTLDFSGFTSFSSASNILSITQDGKGIGAVTSISIEKNGEIFALLSNGQSAVIGTIGLVNFSNPEGLTRTGNNLMQQSAASGEPIVGRPQTGTFGAVQSGSIELSTVDIANEFVKMITLQR